MMPIDIFINQLIQLGLADSFLDVIEKHYLKVSEIYSLISDIDTNNIKNISCFTDENNDSITVILELYNPIDDIVSSSSNELTVQTNNEDNIVTITVTNNYESEEDIYEIRFNGYAKSYNHKWS